MVRRRYNNVLILGMILLLIGGGLFLAGLNGARLRLKRPDVVTMEQSWERVFIMRDIEGEISGQVYAPIAHEHINHNAADDPAFQGIDRRHANGSSGDFLGMYDFNLLNALTIIFLSSGGLLVIASRIRLHPKKRYR